MPLTVSMKLSFPDRRNAKVAPVNFRSFSKLANKLYKPFRVVSDFSTVSTSSQANEDCLNSVFKVMKEKEENGKKTVIVGSVLSGYREKLSFCMFPLPKSLGLTTTVLIRKTSKGYQMVLVDQKEIVLMEATEKRSTISGRSYFGIYLFGRIRSSIGKVVHRHRTTDILIRSYCKAFDYSMDLKHQLFLDSKPYGKAPLTRVGTISKNKTQKVEGLVLDGIREVREWDAVQSLTGYYGINYSSPYRRLNEDSKEWGYINNALFNEIGRSSDKLGEKYDCFPCMVETEASKISVKHGATRFTYYSEEMVSSPTTGNEYSLSFSWPLSPLMAFSLFLGMR